MSAPITPYTRDLDGREPVGAIRETASRVEELTRDWTPAMFERQYAPGKWSARTVLIHLAQSELALGARARMALTTPDYASQSFDQDAWMAREQNMSGREAADTYVCLARFNAAFYAGLSDADRQTAFSHPEYGALTVDWLIHQTAGHQVHHYAQLQALG
jgi:hypothetical protein